MREKNVTNRVIAYVNENIQIGNWKVGDKLPSEHEICNTLDVSRISVRSALQHFIALGVLRSVQGKGTFLINDDTSAFAPSLASIQEIIKTPQTLEDMRHLLEFRALIEPEICATIAPTADEELLTRLEGLLDEMKKNVKNSSAFVTADMEFHMAICRAQGNPITTAIMQDVSMNRIRNYIDLNHTVGSYGGIYYHSLILEALRRHDAKTARHLMKEHLIHTVGDIALDYEKIQ